MSKKKVIINHYGLSWFSILKLAFKLRNALRRNVEIEFDKKFPNIEIDEDRTFNTTITWKFDIVEVNPSQYNGTHNIVREVKEAADE